MIKVRTIPAEALSKAEYEDWEAVHQSMPGVDSAFFHPEWTRIVADIRGNVEVGIIMAGDEPLAYFPFQRVSKRVALPVGGRLSEFHGVVARTFDNWSPLELLEGCNLAAWHFDHLPVGQLPFRPFFWGASKSSAIDLTQGFDAYRLAKREEGNTFAQVERKARKLAREKGDIRFSYHTARKGDFDALIEWKDQQHARTSVLRIMKIPWVVRLLESIYQTNTDGFKGVLSTLHAGDSLIAAHLGIVSKRAMHIWFPAYDMAYERYSPGLVLLRELIRSASYRDTARIDFGPGAERYKQNFKNCALDIAEGAVDRRWVMARLRRSWFEAKRCARGSKWRKTLETPLDLSRKIRQRLAFK